MANAQSLKSCIAWRVAKKFTRLLMFAVLRFIVNKRNRASKAKFVEIASNDVDAIGRVDPIINPYVMTEDIEGCEIEQGKEF